MNKKIIVLLSIFTIIIGTIPFSYSVDEQISVFRGKDYQDITYVNGTHVTTIGLPNRVLNNGNWVSDILTQNSTHYTIISGLSSFSVDKLNCNEVVSYANSTITQPDARSISSLYHQKVTDDPIKGVWLLSDVNLEQCQTSAVQNATGIYISGIKENKITEDKLIITYVKEIDKQAKKSWKYINGVHSKQDQKYGIIDSVESLTNSVIEIENSRYELTTGKITEKNDNGSTKGTPEDSKSVDKTTLTMDEVKMISNDGTFHIEGFTQSKQYLQDIIVGKTTNGLSTLIRYLDDGRQLQEGDILYIDPTFSSNNPTLDNSVRDSGNDICDTGVTLFDNTVLPANAYDTPDSNDCYRSQAEFSTSSIPDGATILDTDISLEVISISGTNVIDFVGLTSKPSTPLTAAQLFTAITNGDLLVDADATVCASTGIKNIDLGSAGDTYVENQLSSGYVSIAFKQDDETIDGTLDACQFASETHATAQEPILTIVWEGNTNQSYSSAFFIREGADNDCTTTGTLTNFPQTTTLDIADDYDTPDSNGDCGHGFIQFDVSGISDSASITYVGFNFEVQSVTGDTKNCDIVAITSDIDTETNTNLYSQSKSGTVYVNNNSFCTTTGEKLLDLGASAVTDLQARLTTTDVFAVSFKHDAESINAVRDNTKIYLTGGSVDPTLIVVYQSAPSAPTNLNVTTVSTEGIDLSWTAPDSDPAITGWKIWMESPTGNGFSTLVADTGNDTAIYELRSLTSGTQYNFKVAGINAIGLGDNSTSWANYTIPDAPTGLIANTISTDEIDLEWTAPSGTVNGYKIERESPEGGGFSDLVSNTTTTDVTYADTGLTASTVYNYRVSAHNLGGTSSPSNEYMNETAGPITPDILFIRNQTGDAVELIPTVEILEGGSPSITISNLQMLKNGTSLNNTALSIVISTGETKQLGRNFGEALDADFVYNFTAIVSIQNSTGTFTFSNSTIITPIYTATYFTSSQGNYQVSYTHSRSNSFANLNLVVNRQNLPANTECNFRDELFEDGDWANVTNAGWYNLTVSVVPTQNVYITCYNDELLFSTISNGGTNATLAFVDYMNQLGTFAGVPIPFLFVFLLAGIFTGRSAITGIIFVTITIGVMGSMGFLPDVNGDPVIGQATWGLIIFLCGIGVFVGKKYF